jgi:hypothetical protein
MLDMKNEIEWVRRELDGYTTLEDFPEYRKISSKQNEKVFAFVSFNYAKLENFKEHNKQIDFEVSNSKIIKADQYDWFEILTSVDNEIYRMTDRILSQLKQNHTSNKTDSIEDLISFDKKGNSSNLVKSSDFFYDVAFSFAGEQREYVKEVYKILSNEYNVRVFFDDDVKIQADLWGRDLIEEFQKIYGEKSKYCVVFVSKEYKEKVWTNLERRNALLRAINEKREYLLPARFDNTEIPGILNSTHYINIANMKPQNFSHIILRKLGIPLKGRDTSLTSFNLPDIKVNVTETTIVSGIPGSEHTVKTQHFLNIKVSNHDTLPIFLTYPKIKLKNSDKSIHIINNDLFDKSISEIGRLEPGNSFDVYINPEKYADTLKELDYVVITDKIDRNFISNPDELNQAIEKWKELKSENR